jgi:hypothetical protein
MTTLATLRRCSPLIRAVLVWFALSLGVAVAAPLVQAQSDLVICTAAGMVRVVVHADGSVDTEPSAQAHCPLCVPGGAPPTLAYQVALPTAQAPAPTPWASRAVLPLAAQERPPARAPPAL